MKVEGASVLVTGAAHGIGRATAIEFANRGADVALADIDESETEKVRSEIEKRGRRAISMRVDVASETDVTEMIRATSADFGLDILVNNAGVSISGPAEAVPIEDWRWVVDVNLWAHVYAIRAALPIFRERGSGHLVHVSSAGGILGTPGLAAYCMTKFAVYGLAESVAVALHGTGVGVSVVCPLWVDTDITNRGRLTPDPQMGVDEATLKLLGREMLRTQGLPPEKVAEAIVSGVEEERFLILPHPEVQAFATAKWEDPERYIHRAAEVLDARRRLFGDSG